MSNEIITGEVLKSERDSGVNDVKIYENTEKDDKSSNELEESTAGVIEGELINNRWILSSVNGDLEYLKENARSNVGKVDDSGYTALMYSADAGHIDCVKFLSSFKEEVRKQDNEGNTALIYATKRNYVDIVRVLVVLEGGIKNKENKSALDYAKENNYKECIKILQDVEGNSEKESKKNKNELENSLKTENKKLKVELKEVRKANDEISKIVEVEKVELNEMETANSEIDKPERENIR